MNSQIIVQNVGVDATTLCTYFVLWFTPRKKTFLRASINLFLVQIRILPVLTLQIKFFNSDQLYSDSRQKVGLMTWGLNISWDY